ncbi:MAG: rhodanese-like domain-containing protein [Verrucomicrobia bacterium]|nr:rhodanese-like domain-containing protein [Verrucomicrobiota bacterium]MCH8511288.1 rhodanese-like domain-containing protein [Kiritimatiellia bacterium]
MKSSPSATCFGIVYLIAVSLVTGLMSRGLSSDPLPWDHAWSEGLREEVLAAGFEVVDTSEMRRLVEEGRHLILDARSMQEYDMGQIPGAMPLPIGDFEDHFLGIAPILSPDSPLIAYCSSAECDQALILAERLREAGYPNVKIYLDGWKAWNAEVGP